MASRKNGISCLEAPDEGDKVAGEVVEEEEGEEEEVEEEAEDLSEGVGEVVEVVSVAEVVHVVDEIEALIRVKVSEYAYACAGLD